MAADATPYLLKCKDNINSMINQVRNLSKSIVPTTLASRQLDDLLHLLVARYKDQPFTLSYTYNGAKDLHPDLSLAIYRVLEEALDNVATHAKASKASIDVVVGERVVIAVEDDGCGFETSALEQGSGINMMLSIVEYYNGTIDLDTAPGEGCRLLISVPHFKSA